MLVVVLVLCPLSCCCSMFVACGCVSAVFNKRKHVTYTASGGDVDDPCLNFSFLSCNAAVCALSIVGLGANLLLRHTLGQCDFDPDDNCSGSGSYTGNPARGSTLKSGKDCSQECDALETAGILIPGVLFFCCACFSCLGRLFCRKPTDSGSQRKIGCDCCYCTV